MTATEQQIHRYPTAEEQEAVAWWNSLSHDARERWLTQAQSASAADAWACYKRATLPVDHQAILAEHETAMQRAVDEANEYIVDAEDSLIVAALTDIITDHPGLLAIRFLRLERQVEELRHQVDASTHADESEGKIEDVPIGPGLFDHRPWHPLFGPCVCSDCVVSKPGGAK